MTDVKELCRRVLKTRYDINTEVLTTVGTYRKLYDFVQRNKGVIGLNINTLDESLDSLNKLLDYIESEDLDALCSIKGIEEHDIEKIKKARNKMKNTINSSISSVKDICQKIERNEEVIDISVMEIQASHRINIIESMRIKRLINENDILRKKLEEIRKVEESRKNLIELFNRLIQDKNVKESITKEELLDFIDLMMKALRS